MNIVLLIHIASATITLITCVLAWYRPSEKIGKLLTKFTILSVVSGAIVTLDHYSITLAVCAKLGLYLLTIMTTQYMLYQTSKKTKVFQIQH